MPVDPTEAAITKLAKRVSNLEVDQPVGGMSDHNHTSAPGDGGILTDDEHDGFIDVGEIGAPAPPVADVARIFAADDGGTTKLYYERSDGTIIEIGLGHIHRPDWQLVWNGGGTPTHAFHSAAMAYDGTIVEARVRSISGTYHVEWRRIVDLVADWATVAWTAFAVHAANIQPCVVAQEQNDDVFVFFISSNFQQEIYYYRSTDDGQTWGAGVKIEDITGTNSMFTAVAGIARPEDDPDIMVVWSMSEQAPTHHKMHCDLWLDSTQAMAGSITDWPWGDYYAVYGLSVVHDNINDAWQCVAATTTTPYPGNSQLQTWTISDNGVTWSDQATPFSADCVETLFMFEFPSLIWADGWRMIMMQRGVYTYGQTSWEGFETRHPMYSLFDTNDWETAINVEYRPDSTRDHLVLAGWAGIGNLWLIGCHRVWRATVPPAVLTTS